MEPMAPAGPDVDARVGVGPHAGLPPFGEGFFGKGCRRVRVVPAFVAWVRGIFAADFVGDSLAATGGYRLIFLIAGGAHPAAGTLFPLLLPKRPVRAAARAEE